MKPGCCVDGCCSDETCMRLPEGRTCGDCANLARCGALFGCGPARRSCDFYPRLFRAAAPAPVAEALP